MQPIPPIGGHAIHRFELPLIHSNMYVVLCGGDALIVDPCLSQEAVALLRDSGVTHCTILLTHEHYDHISGVNQLRDSFSCTVICTEVCTQRMASPRRNHAAVFPAMFFSQGPEAVRQAAALFDTHYTCTAEETYSGILELQWHDIPLRLIELPGHSPGSAAIEAAGTHVFTGDNLIPGAETLVRLPGGDKTVYLEQVVPYLRRLAPSMVLLPGHGPWCRRSDPLVAAVLTP